MNLLRETLNVMAQNGRGPDDIVFIGSRSGYSCTWEQYETLADVNYDAGYGSAEVADDLEIAFNDGAVMTRGEYDGSEWWNYRAPFVPPVERKPIVRLVQTDGGYQDTLEEIHRALSEPDLS